jgi:hypothetical protein
MPPTRSREPLRAPLGSVQPATILDEVKERAETYKRQSLRTKVLQARVEDIGMHLVGDPGRAGIDCFSIAVAPASSQSVEDEVGCQHPTVLAGQDRRVERDHERCVNWLLPEAQIADPRVSTTPSRRADQKRQRRLSLSALGRPVV